MTAAEKIAAFLANNRGRAYCDDCLSKGLDIRPRQQVQQKTSVLALSPLFVRRKATCHRCGNEKLVIGTRMSGAPATRAA